MFVSTDGTVGSLLISDLINFLCKFKNNRERSFLDSRLIDLINDNLHIFICLFIFKNKNARTEAH